MDQISPIEENLRRLLSEIDRQRFDRAKRFVDERVRRDGGGETAHHLRARWLKFLCSRTPAQRHVLLQYAEFLRHFATDFGLSSDERREFVNLSLLGGLWRNCYFEDLMKGPSELVARLTRVTGWDHFDRCRQDGAGLILLPVHGQFSRLYHQYLHHRGYDGLSLGLPNHKHEQMGFRTTVNKQFVHARQMHAAKDLLTRGGIVFNLPDAFQNLDNCRSVEFFGRRRRLAAGFAELALMTGARVVPIAYRFSPRGFFVLECGSPLAIPGAQSTREARVDSLVGQYADFLRNEWRRYPWNIPWHHLRHYCRLPKFNTGALGENANPPRSSDARSDGARWRAAQ